MPSSDSTQTAKVIAILALFTLHLVTLTNGVMFERSQPRADPGRVNFTHLPCYVTGL